MLINMRFILTLLGFASPQIPIQNPLQPIVGGMANQSEFAFKEGSNIFSPKDLIELGRPGDIVANDAGDFGIVSFSKFSFEDQVNKKSIFVVSLESDVEPLQIPLEKGGETFWLDTGVIGHAVEGNNGLDIYAIYISWASNQLTTSGTPVKIGELPSKSATNFRYNILSHHLVFSDYVYEDGNLTSVKEQDEAWESRGNSAFVYDKTYERHWDTWRGPKRSQLFSVILRRDPNHNWTLGKDFSNPLKGTGHHCPVEPFGGAEDYSVSSTHIAYTTIDPKVDDAWHTRQNIYIVDIEGKDSPRELTSGKQGATHNPVFSTNGRKVAWLELDEEGYEADRAKIVIYDLEKDVRFTVTQEWDRSPSALSFSKDDSFLYITVGDIARVKIFALPVAPTPSESTTHPKLDRKYTTPVPISNSGAVSGVQPLSNHRVVFSRSSFTSPNDVYIMHGLKDFQDALLQGSSSAVQRVNTKKLTRFSEDSLRGKELDAGEEFWFKGANDKDIQGWTFKPPGWKAGEKKKWPVALLIHGGPQGAWEDQWSTRWNPNVFSQHGYFVVLINPTGSTSFGQELTDAIQKDWGGKPFVDMVKGWKYILNKYEEIDTDRAVAAGASYGGYAINWIQGHPEFDFGFKALVCHDGVFDTKYDAYSTDELFFANHEWGGRPWEPEARKVMEQFNPANFVDRWSTPQLVIHGSKDYRLPETGGIGVFHALQQLGVPSRLVIFPDENHWVLKHGNSLKWHYEVLRWFHIYTAK